VVLETMRVKDNTYSICVDVYNKHAACPAEMDRVLTVAQRCNPPSLPLWGKTCDM
jgi:hypothetical protein